jgi:hypothetical protein
LRPPPRRDLIVLVILSILICVARLRTYHEPPEWDVGTYQAIARELLSGEQLYADAWDIKPPGIFAAYASAQAVFGDGALPIYLLSVTCAIATMCGLYFAAGRSIVAASFWVAMCFDPGTGANLPNTEVFINACVAWALALWLGAHAISWRRAIAIGALFAVASLFKQVAIVIAISICIASLKDVRKLVAMASVIALVWGATFGYFAVTGRGWIAWQTLVVAPRAYSGGMLHNLAQSVLPSRMFPGYVVFAAPAAALTIVALVADARRRVLIALGIGAQLAIVLPGQFFPHYYQLWFVPLSLGAAWGAAALPKLIAKPRLARVVIALALIAMIAPQLPWYALDGREWARRQFGDFYLYAHDAFRDADRMLAPGETFYAWCDEPYGYAVARRRPPATALWKMHTTTGPLADWLTQRTLADLDRTKPKLIIVYGEDPQPAGHPILVWTKQHYDPLPDENRKHFPLFFYVRREK